MPTSSKRSASSQWIWAGATVFGLGRLAWAPGTWGSLAALPLWWARARLGLAGRPALAATAALTGAAVALAAAAEREAGEHDRQDIVIDEVVGMLWMAHDLPFRAAEVAWGFALFRLLDALKPPPIGWIDRHVGGGLGVVLDDVAAGLAAGSLVRLARRLRGR